MNDHEQRTFTLAQTAKILGLSENGLRARVWRGTLPAVRLGRRVLVRRADLERITG